MIGLAASGTGGGSILFGAFLQYLLDKIHLQWTLCVEALILCTVIIFSFLLTPGPNGKTTTGKNGMVETASSNGEKNIVNKNTNLKSADIASDGTCTNIWDLSLFKNPTYVIYCISCCTAMFGYYVPQIYLPEYAISRGITHQKAANLNSIIGVANLASRIIFALISDFGPRLRLCLCGLSITFLGVISIALPFFNTYPVLVLYAILFGKFIGGFVSLYGVILVDLYGVEVIEKSFGQVMTVISPVLLFGSPLMGFFIDTFGDITLSFYIPGIASTLGGFLFLGILCFHKFHKQDYEKIKS